MTAATTKMWKVTAGFDFGDAESGPMIDTDWVIIEASTAEEAEKLSGFQNIDGFCGCYGRPAEPEEIKEYERRLEEERDWDAQYEEFIKKEGLA